MYQGKKVTAIITAAGSGVRFGAAFNKVFCELDGEPLYRFSLSVFGSHPAVDEIIITVKSGEEILFDTAGTKKPVRLIPGGKTRRESVMNAVIAAEGDIILIQDAARPFLRQEYIDGCLGAMPGFSGATVASPARDTVKLARENGAVALTTDRSRTFLIQTPQCFRREVLLRCSLAYDGSYEATDECMLLEHEGEEVALITGGPHNIKITDPLDLEIAGVILHAQTDTHAG